MMVFILGQHIVLFFPMEEKKTLICNFLRKATIKAELSKIDSIKIKPFEISSNGSSVGEWLGRSLAVLGVSGSSLLTASLRYDV